MVSCVPSFPTGGCSVLRKIADLPLVDLLHPETAGGWGRTVRSAEQLEKKLSRDPESIAEASKLRAHLSLVTTARSIQPAHIPSRTDAEIEAAINTLLHADVVIPAVAIAALLARRAKTFARGCEEQPNC